MKKFISRYASIKSTLLLLGLVLVFNLVVFPFAHPAGLKLGILDLYFSYSVMEAYQLLDTYTEANRHTYLLVELTVDLVYPWVYSFALCFLIFLLSSKLNLSLFPFLILIVDYFENFGIATLIYYYPQKLLYIAAVTSLFTSIKWVLVILSVLIVLYGLTAKGYRFMMKNN